MIVYGSLGVGKSQLTMRYVLGDFLEDYDPTIEDWYRKLIDVNGQPVYLNILDTAGAQDFRSMWEELFRNWNIFFLIFSITCRDSWGRAALYRRRLLKTKDDNDCNVLYHAITNQKQTCYFYQFRNIFTFLLVIFK